MATYSNLAEVADNFANYVGGLDAQSPLDNWESALKALCKEREASVQTAKTPAFKIKAKRELSDAQGALRLISQKSLFEKLGRHMESGGRRSYEATLAKATNEGLIPTTADHTYEEWMGILDKAERTLGPAPAPTPPPTPVITQPPPAPVITPPPPAPVITPQPPTPVIALTPPTPVIAKPPPTPVIAKPPPTPVVKKPDETVASVAKVETKPETKPAKPAVIPPTPLPVPSGPKRWRWILPIAASAVIASVLLWKAYVTPKTVKVTITSEPAGADVYVDGVKQAGTTPLLNLELAAGPRHIEARKDNVTDSTNISLDPVEQGGVVNLVLPVTPKTVKVTVTSEPSGAILSYRSGSTGERGTNGTTPGNLDLPPGGYFIIVSLAGYQQTNQFIHLEEGKPQEINLAMAPATALLSVLTEPTGATVSIDGAAQEGRTPAVNLGITQGRHRIEVALSGYQSTNREVFVNSANPVVDFGPLAPERISVSINSVPSGAKIRIGSNSDLGTTPRTLMFLPGLYNITLQLDGYEDGYISGYEVKTGQTPQPINPTLRQIQLKMSVSSTPSGASIWRGGRPLDAFTPATIPVFPGTGVITLKLTGYKDEDIPFEVKAGQTPRPINPTLQALLLTMSVGSTPSGASIWIDGKPLPDATPAEVQLGPGTYAIALKLAGYEDARFPGFEVKPGQTPSPINPTLRAIPSRMSVKSAPSGASISVDNVLQSVVTPTEELQFSPGHHAIRLQLAGYEDVTSEREITPGVSPPPIFVTFQPLRMTVYVNSDPPGAEILLDSHSTGKTTPYNLEVSPGNHNIQLIKGNDYYSASVPLEIRTGETPQPISRTLTRKPNPSVATPVVPPVVRPYNPPASDPVAGLMAQCSNYARGLRNRGDINPSQAREAKKEWAAWREKNLSVLNRSTELQNAYEDVLHAINTKTAGGDAH